MAGIKRIILDASGNLLLQARAARFSIEDGRPKDGLACIAFENGEMFGVKWNKDSVRVYPQSATPPSPEVRHDL